MNAPSLHSYSLKPSYIIFNLFMRVGHSDSDGGSASNTDLTVVPVQDDEMGCLQIVNKNSDSCEFGDRLTQMVEQGQTFEDDLINHYEDDSHFPQSFNQQKQLFEGRMQEEERDEESEEYEEEQDFTQQVQDQNSEDQQIQQDQYQSDNSSDQNPNNFDSLFYVAIDPFKTKVNDKVFLDPYKTIKKGQDSYQNISKPQQTLIRQQQMPYQMLLKGHSARQNLLALINHKYFYRLKHEGGQHRSFLQQSQQFNRTSEQEDDASSISDYKSQAESATEEKKAKRVVFKDLIQMKMFNHDDEVTTIRQTQQLSQYLNTNERPPSFRRLFQLSPMEAQMVSEPQINQNRTRSYSNPQIMIDQQGSWTGNNNGKQINMVNQEDNNRQKWCNSQNNSFKENKMQLGQRGVSQQESIAKNMANNIQNMKSELKQEKMQVELGSEVKSS